MFTTIRNNEDNHFAPDSETVKRLLDRNRKKNQLDSHIFTYDTCCTQPFKFTGIKVNVNRRRSSRILFTRIDHRE